MLNIVQAEFFHVDGAEAAASGSKTVVRFFDESGKITDLAMRAANLRKNKKEAEQHNTAQGFCSTLLEKKITFLSVLVDRVEDKCEKLVYESIHAAAFDSNKFAIKKRDHSFRTAHKSEFHDIRARIQRAKGMRLFVFEPNRLLFDDNTLIADVVL